jgi:hypothetical protein
MGFGMGFGIWDGIWDGIWEWDGIWDWDGNGIWDLGWDGMGWAGMGWDSKWVASILVTVKNVTVNWLIQELERNTMKKKNSFNLL